MMRWQKFKRLPIAGKVVLIIFTPFAFVEIFCVNLAALIDSVAHFWANKGDREEGS
jgi:hypothetical protein